jgi:endonuclease III
MKSGFILLLLGVVAALSTGSAQTPDANQQQQLLALVKQVQNQQAQMAENEAKIEEKLATLSETIRSARIYTKREK